MYSQPIKAEIIVNRQFHKNPLGPVARIVMSDGRVFWVYSGDDGYPVMSAMEVLSHAEIEDEMRVDR